VKELELLIELQRLNDFKREFKADLVNDNILEEIELYKQRIKEEESKLEERKEVVDILEHKVKEKEFEDARLKLQEEDYKEQLYSGDNTSPKELQKLQEKLSRIEDSKEQLEDGLLELMMQLEEDREEMKRVEDEFLSLKNNLADLEEEFIEKKKSLKEEFNDVNNKKKRLEEKIDEDLLVKYKELYKKRNGKAVVELKDDCCLGCRMALSLNSLRKVKDSQELTFCEHCGRILYYQE